MRPRLALPIALALLVTALPFPGAVTASDAGGALVADAGDSRVATPGTPTPVEARVLGGTPPFEFAWSLNGSGERFADAGAASTTFDATGLPPGSVDLALTVTDADGRGATDTVRYLVAAASRVLDARGTVPAGAPDEYLASGLVDQGTQDFPFQVASGTTRLDAALSWAGAWNDLDFVLIDPAGREATGNAGRTSNLPERVGVNAPAPGTWIARVEAFVAAGTSFRVTVDAAQAQALPRAHAPASLAFGHLDDQRVIGGVSSVVEPALVAWDLDLDGAYEAAGTEAVADLPEGAHVVALKVTDARGFEARATSTLTVRHDVDHVLRLSCGGDPNRPYWAMEFSASKGSCWMHGGHHTYFLGGAFTLAGGSGNVFSVEQQFTPPTEYADAPFTTPIHVEASLDGREWATIGEGEYVFLDGTSLPTRQRVHVTLNATEEPFRFVRFSQPKSAAQGLSGFLDSSGADLLVHRARDAVPPPGAATPGSRTLSCAGGDVMEDFFAEHPCWFGGVNRYDSPSFQHSYFLEQSTLTRVAGEVTIAPWRTDDWFLPLVPPAEQVTGTQVIVQASRDGISWATLGTAPVPFGVPTTFDLALDGEVDASFVRVIPDYHPRFDNAGAQPSLHHPEGFLVGSTVTVTGALRG